MGSHPDHALHKVFHQWRSRAKRAEMKLARIEARLFVYDSQRGPRIGHVQTLDDIRTILKED